MKFLDLSFTDDSKFLYLGKVPKTEDNYLILDWVDAGVSFNFKGKGIIFFFSDYCDDTETYITVFVDGKRERHSIYSKSDKVVIDLDEDTTHTIELIRVTEGFKPLILKGFTIKGDNPALLSPRKKKDLELFFIGDSITVGFGVTGDPKHSVFYNYEEDSTMSYSYFTKELLDAEISVSGHSGHGVVQAYGGVRTRTTMKEMFLLSSDNSTETYDYKGFEPSIVIINAGTNDISAPIDKEEFYNGCIDLLKTIRTTFKNTPIIWLYGVCTSELSEEIKKAIDDFKDNAYFLLVDKAIGDEIGSVNHPGINASIRVSKILSNEIKKILKL